MYKSIEEVEERIELNYHAVKCIESLVDNQMYIEDKLELISLCGLFYSEYVTGVYGSNILEKKLFEIGNTIEFATDKVAKENEYLFVMTKAGSLGGHSVIVNNWILWDKNIKYSIVFTDFDIEYVPEFLKEAVKISGGNLYFLHGSHLEKAKQLLQISQNFSKIILLQHMYDMIPNLAYSNLKWNIPVILYNHANFKFSFGYEISDRVLNLLEYDVNKTTLSRGVDEKESVFLQFPNGGKILRKLDDELLDSKEREDIAQKYNICPSRKTVVSMGESFKFNDILDCSFTTFVEKLIDERNGDIQYIIIGANSNEQKWKEMEKNTKGRARAVGYLDRKTAEALISVSDLYIVSFPMAAFGANFAEKYDIPYLAMSVTGRGIENYGNNAVTSIEELLQKANEILDGNKEQYKGSYSKRILNQEEWCKEWHNIADNIVVHKRRQIEPKRLIQKEEIVNCQLMQEKADTNVKRLLSEVKLTTETIKTIMDISEKYQLDCLPEYFFIINWKNHEDEKIFLQQKMKLLSYSNRWLYLSLRGYRISDYFEKRKINSIAIYGMGQIGLNLLEALRNTNVKVECFVDRNAGMLQAPIRLIDLRQTPNISRTIVTTVGIDETKLRQDYACLTDEYEIISLFEIIDNATI